jgi:hypothetical protein
VQNNNTMQLEVVNYDKLVMPDWFGREDIHKSHRLKLSWKQWDWYYDKFEDVTSEPSEEPEYVWPV